MLKINKDIELQLLKNSQVGSFEDLQKTDISASVISLNDYNFYNYYIYYTSDNDGPFLVEEYEGKLLISRDRYNQNICHCSEHNPEKDIYLYNGSDMINSYKFFKCNQCEKEYSIKENAK